MVEYISCSLLCFLPWANFCPPPAESCGALTVARVASSSHLAANSSPTAMDKHPSDTAFHPAWPQIFSHGGIANRWLRLPSTSVSRARLWPARDPLEDAWASSAHAVGGGGLVGNAPSLRLAVFLMAGINCRKESGGELHVGWKSPGRSTSFQSCISLRTDNSAATLSCRNGK